MPNGHGIQLSPVVPSYPRLVDEEGCHWFWSAQRSKIGGIQLSPMGIQIPWCTNKRCRIVGCITISTCDHSWRGSKGSVGIQSVVILAPVPFSKNCLPCIALLWPAWLTMLRALLTFCFVHNGVQVQNEQIQHHKSTAHERVLPNLVDLALNGSLVQFLKARSVTPPIPRGRLGRPQQMLPGLGRSWQVWAVLGRS